MEQLAIINGLCFVKEFVKANVLIENGIIKKITKQDVKEVKAENTIDAKNCFVIPAFFNAHTHAAMTLLRCIVEDAPLMDWLKAVWSVESKMKEKDVYWGTKLAILEMIKSGIACFSDMYFHMDGVAKAVEESKIRAVLGYGMIDMDDEEKREKEVKETKRFVEKWGDKDEDKNKSKNKNKIKLSITPHSPYTCSSELLKESVKLAKKYNLPVHIHLAETKNEVEIVKEKTGKTPVKYLDELGLFEVNTVAAHCVWLSSDEINLLAKKGISVAHCPISNMKLGSGIAKVAEMLEAGVNVCLGTDGAASNNCLSILQEMKFAALLQKLSNVEAVKAIEVFRMASENGYKAYGLKGGKIKEGYLADIAILRKGASYTPLYNPIYSVVYSSYGFEVRDLIVGGDILMIDRELKTIDEEEVIEKAESFRLKLKS